MFEFLNDAMNYEDRKVGRDTVSGIDVSTAYTSDEGYETAILDANGAHPVERYDTKEEAIKGHAGWVKKAPTLKKITKLGWIGLVDEQQITLKRKA